jgi:hypothetical protein
VCVCVCKTFKVDTATKSNVMVFPEMSPCSEVNWPNQQYFCTCISKVPGSNIGLQTDYGDLRFSWLSGIFQDCASVTAASILIFATYLVCFVSYRSTVYSLLHTSSLNLQVIIIIIMITPWL